MIHELANIGWPGALVLIAAIAAIAYVLGVMFRS
jgi:hypothetical protein